MSNERFVLAQYGRKVELVLGSFPKEPRVGDDLERKPASTKEDWVIVKTFNEVESEDLNALTHLMGFEKVKDFFKVTIR